MSLPNLLTAVRLLLVPLIIWLMLERRYADALTVFVAAGITDMIDGYLARNFSMRTELGAWLDPLADKVLLVSSYIVLALMGELPLWLTVLVIGRDIAILIGIGLSYALGQSVRFEPILLSKINTALQIVLVALVLLLLAMDERRPDVVMIASIAVAATTLGSWLQYFLMWLRSLRAKPRESS